MNTPSPVAIDEAVTELTTAMFRARQRGNNDLHDDLREVVRWLRDVEREQRHANEAPPGSGRQATVFRSDVTYDPGAGLNWTSSDGSP